MKKITKNMEKAKPQYIAGGNVKWAAAEENSLAVPQNVKYRITA